MDLEETARASIDRALANLTRLQGADGAWPGDYGGPMFLLPMYVALCHVSGRVPAAHREGMLRYFLNVQNADGSIGLHAEDTRGSMFTTALGYVAVRLLGAAKEDARVARMRAWIHANGTPLGAATWGKFTLCLLGLYEWRGIHPILPELWLLPRRTPFHPSRLWCHARQVYLPMAWLYGKRASASGDLLRGPLTELREELYGGAWSSIDWESHRDTLCPTDAYRPPTAVLRAANRIMDAYERTPVRALRERALEEILEHVDYEDAVTGFLDIGPVNKVLNAFVHHARDPGGSAFRRAFGACEAYLWPGHDGTKMQGYESSKLWDTAFAVQAILATRRCDPPVRRTLERAYDYLRDNQILEDVPDAARHFRDASRGGWPFSSRAHGWPITDCTSEGLKCAIGLEPASATTGASPSPPIPRALLHDAVALLLAWQNDDGGWATYERQRGGAWFELLNPSEVFGDIMVDYSYVECTSSCLTALVEARRGLRDGSSPATQRRIDDAIARGDRFLRAKQRADGSFEGSWGVCFTYGTWFGVTGLRAAGASVRDPAVVLACNFLLSKQRDDGAWGEHGDSCREHSYIQAPAGGAAQTAWALSALVRAGHGSGEPQERAARYLIGKQEADGSWAREPMVGVFNRTCLINYDNYRHYFPPWALAEWVAYRFNER